MPLNQGRQDKAHWIFIAIVIVTLVAAVIQQNYMNGLQRIDGSERGVPVATVISPNREHIAKAYALNDEIYIGHAILVEVYSTGASPEGVRGFQRNIYFDLARYGQDVRWLDNETVFVNGKPLNIYTDSWHLDFSDDGD